MTDITSHHDKLVAKAQDGLADLTATLTRKIESLHGLAIDRTTEDQTRLAAKARGVEAGLRIAQAAEAPTTALWAMREALPEAAEDERPGLEIAIQDAVLIARL